MFSFQETTRVTLCRWAFAALCVVPTGAVGAWCVVVRLPAYTFAHERAIAAELGLQAQLARASSPRPGVMRYHALELSDPETGQPLARCPLVEVQAAGGTVRVTLPAAALINGTRLDAFWRAAREHVRPSGRWRQLHFTAGNVTVHLRGGDAKFVDVGGEIDNAAEHAQFKLSFRHVAAGRPAAEAAMLSYVRHWQTKPPGGTLQLTTGDAPLPCELATSIWPGVERAGSGCAFRGRVFVPEQNGNWRIQLAGRLTELDLDRLISDQFAHKLTGLADVEIEQAVVERGRLEAASGRLTAGPGSISDSLVLAAQAHLRLRVPSEIRPGGASVGYRRMACAFSIGPRGLVLRGEAGETPGTLVVDRRGEPLLGEPSVSVQPVVQLARLLVPRSDVQVPATRETAALIGALPVPSIATMPASEPPANQARSPKVNPKRK